MRTLRGYHNTMGVVLFAIASGCRDAPPAPETSTPLGTVALAHDTERSGPREQLPFANLQLFFEFNSTDNDLGLQLNLDGEDWRRVTGFDPGGRPMVEISGKGLMNDLGLTELFFESAEPSPGEVLALFPPGSYRFHGMTIEGDALVGSATLSHALPLAPVFTPSGGVVDRTQLVVAWQPIPGIAGYQLIVANEATGRNLTVDLAPGVTSFPVAPVFLQPNTLYKIEVLSIAANGNKTITEATVTTSP